MIGISFTEFLVILAALFLIVGPKRLAESAHEAGQWVARVKREIHHFRQTHLGGLDASAFYESATDLNKSLDELKPPEPPRDGA